MQFIEPMSAMKKSKPTPKARQKATKPKPASKVKAVTEKAEKQSPLARYREANGYTLAQLGAMLEANKSTIMRWEDGRVPVEQLSLVSRVTKIPKSVLRPDLYDEE